MRKELECKEQERALQEAFKAEEHRKHQQELEQKHREGGASCQTIKESYKFLPVLHTTSSSIIHKILQLMGFSNQFQHSLLDRFIYIFHLQSLVIRVIICLWWSGG
jgi:hypothetical protein